MGSHLFPPICKAGTSREPSLSGKADSGKQTLIGSEDDPPPISQSSTT